MLQRKRQAPQTDGDDQAENRGRSRQREGSSDSTLTVLEEGGGDEPGPQELLESSKQQVESLKQQVESLEQQVESLSDQQAETRQHSQQVERQVTESSVHAARYTEHLVKVVQVLQSLKQRVECLETASRQPWLPLSNNLATQRHLASLESHLAALESVLRTRASLLEVAIQENANAIQENANAIQALAGQGNTLHVNQLRLQSELAEELNKQFSGFTPSSLRALRAQVDTLDAYLRALRAQVDTNENRVRTRENRREKKVNTEIEGLMAQVSELVARANELVARANELVARVSELEQRQASDPRFSSTAVASSSITSSQLSDTPQPTTAAAPTESDNRLFEELASVVDFQNDFPGSRTYLTFSLFSPTPQQEEGPAGEDTRLFTPK